jgi:hypothetical protein
VIAYSTSLSQSVLYWFSFVSVASCSEPASAIVMLYATCASALKSM